MRRARCSTAAVAIAATLALSGAAGSVGQADPTPAPADVNDFSCHPSAAHPEPVVLLEGLGGDMAAWSYMASGLKAAGYCLFALDYGVDPRIASIPYAPEGSLPMEQSAQQLSAFVDQVLAATGASNVDLVGHSEGTIMPRWYLKFLGGAAKVDRFVALTPLYRGSTVYGVTTLRDALAPLGLSQPLVDVFASQCAACTEVLAGSDYLDQVNAGGEAIPGVTYTNIVTEHDELVVPYTSGFEQGPGAYTNIDLQQVCPADLSEHVAVAFDPVVKQMILNALDPTNAKPVSCGLLPYVTLS